MRYALTCTIRCKICIPKPGNGRVLIPVFSPRLCHLNNSINTSEANPQLSSLVLATILCDTTETFPVQVANSAQLTHLVCEMCEPL